MVTTVPAALMVAEPKGEAFVQPAGAAQLMHCPVMFRQADCVPQAELVLQ